MRIDHEDGSEIVTLRIPMTLERRGGRKLVIAPEGAEAPSKKPERDETLVRALVKAHRWRRIESGGAKSITDLAAQEGVTDAYVCRLLPLTCLSPDIAEAILDGRLQQPIKLSALLRHISPEWESQRNISLAQSSRCDDF